MRGENCGSAQGAGRKKFTNIRLTRKREQGLTLLEVLMVLAALLILVAFILPELPSRPYRAPRIQCVNNLKQIGLGTRVWSGDHNDKYPMAVSVTNGGAMEFTTGPNLWRVMQVMSNELSTPKVLNCPADTDRSYATNFTYLRNSNLSFFVGIVASEFRPSLQSTQAMILSGDRNITNGLSIQNGVLKLTTNDLAGWTKALHNNCGNIGLADGSVQEVSMVGLRNAIAGSGVETNLVQMPILGP